MVNLRKPPKRFNIRKKIQPQRPYGNTVRFRRYEPLSSEAIPLNSDCVDPGPDPVNYEELNLLYSDAKKAWDARDNYWSSLRQSQLEYNVRKARQLSEMPKYKFNTIRRRKKQMFNEDEVSFIEETAKKDLKSIQIKIESLVNEMARTGKQLSDMKAVESKLTSILRAIEEDREDDRCRGAC